MPFFQTQINRRLITIRDDTELLFDTCYIDINVHWLFWIWQHWFISDLILCLSSQYIYLSKVQKQNSSKLFQRSPKHKVHYRKNNAGWSCAHLVKLPSRLHQRGPFSYEIFCNFLPLSKIVKKNTHKYLVFCNFSKNGTFSKMCQRPLLRTKMF